jgi:hypothetical protein
MQELQLKHWQHCKVQRQEQLMVASLGVFLHQPLHLSRACGFQAWAEEAPYTEVSVRQVVLDKKNALEYLSSLSSLSGEVYLSSLHA